jgi:hypothetical protein
MEGWLYLFDWAAMNYIATPNLPQVFFELDMINIFTMILL